jgi:hypothetical protein
MNTPPQYAELPHELSKPRHWCLWRLEPREEGDEPTKIPYSVRGFRAKSSDPRTWATLAEVLEAYGTDPEKWMGIGIMLAPPIVGIDLDNALDESERLLPWARDWFDPALTYGEVSPSHHGAKFLAHAADPETGINLRGFGPDKSGGVEVYGHRRFWTVTGRRYHESPSAVNDCRLIVSGIYARLKLEREARKTAKRQAEAAERRTARPDDVGNPFHRWTRYATTMDPSHSGNNGHTAFFTSMCEAVRFDLSESEMWDAAHWWNDHKTDELWTDEEIRHKIRQAEQKAGHERGRRLTEERKHNPNDEAIGSALQGTHAADANGNGKHYPPAPSFDDEPRKQTFGSGDIAPAEGTEGYCAWVAPKPLPPELPPVMAFDARLLPRSLRPWIVDIADRVQCPPDYPAVGAMVALAGTVGRKVGIRPKRHDDWLVVPNLWGAVIGRPGIMKTPALQEPLKPLKRLEIEAAREHDAAVMDFNAKSMVAKEAEKVSAGKIREALKKGGDAQAVAAEAMKQEVEEPARRRYIVNDSSVEKLGEILNENANGVLVYRDELIGLLKALDKEGQEGARAFYLESWNGNGRYTYDRIGRGTLDITAATVSVIGCIQPGPLADYLRSAINSGAGDDGLVQRFQLAVWPDVSAEWRNVDQYPDTVAKNAAYEVFERLDRLTAADCGAETDHDEPDAIPYLRFAPDAQDVFDDWRAGLEAKVRAGEEHPAMEAHLSKYRSLIPSLALLIHLAEGGKGAVDLPALQRAIAWSRYLETHARRIFADAMAPAVASAKALVRKIVAGELPDGFGKKDVYRPGWSKLKTADDAANAIDFLTDHGWLRETNEQTGGAPRTRYWFNPVCIVAAPKSSDTSPPGTARTAKSPAETLTAVKAVPPQGGSEVSQPVPAREREVIEL